MKPLHHAPVLSQPILIYDGYCNLCIALVQTLEALNANGGEPIMRFIPFQQAESLTACYDLQPDDLQKALHLILPTGEVVKAGKAVAKLSDYFPILKPGSPFFARNIGETLYGRIAASRYRFFGCAKACYSSPFGIPDA